MIDPSPPFKAITIGLIVFAVLLIILITGCAPDYPQLTNYQVELAIAACQKQGGFLHRVGTREVVCVEKGETK